MKRFVSFAAVAVLVAAPLVISVGSAAAGAPETMTFKVTPNPVMAGTTVTFSGTGCLPVPGETAGFPQVVVSFLDDSAGPASSRLAAQVKPFDDDSTVLTATPDANGTWSAPLDVPIDAVGDFKFGAMCDHYNGSASYEPVPLTVDENPNSPAALILPAFADESGVPTLETGTSYEFFGLGFAPGEKVQLTVHSAPQLLATLDADEFGLLDGSFTLPGNTAGGDHTLTLAGEASKKQASLPITVNAGAVPTAPTTVTVSAPSSATTTAPTTQATTAAVVVTVTTSGPTLAATGAAAERMSWVGLALTMLGALTLIFARRRSAHVH
jgi:hypothetical protein